MKKKATKKSIKVPWTKKIIDRIVEKEPTELFTLKPTRMKVIEDNG